jgi:CspA family cold shock protein
MGTGKLKVWNAERGFGFIADDTGGPDMFLHINELKTAGIGPDQIRISDRFTFESTSTRDGKTKASNVRLAWDRAEGEMISKPATRPLICSTCEAGQKLKRK